MESRKTRVNKIASGKMGFPLPHKPVRKKRADKKRPAITNIGTSL
jgi:hypothetical protein